ncbi:aminotransferase class I/II-fold pyridoxal phosphate-dependent enzyme [Candidatus Gracilibacteria bacterium]|nr:aminotransferase class I/II-fold pyridoxal phosphate-dependent enzyme [Candidatus Gracilibacteria bacterium]MCF7856520.1 aminotransferase class I/II-fold pyridoxal phosphate-dependent enzyme [Candidatus Gracilibacteria bacterium]MCF7896584.1 aminotransferase class I/II-fold pyridoxal phosphate-dependent enzyme [Candidatus Gracilibacteria bacterium]
MLKKFFPERIFKSKAHDGGQNILWRIKIMFEKHLDVTRGSPPASLAPIKQLAEAAGPAIMADAGKLAGYYGGALGHPGLREVFAKREGVSVDNVFISPGGMLAFRWTLEAALRRKNYDTYQTSGVFDPLAKVVIGVPVVTYDRAIKTIAQINRFYERLNVPNKIDVVCIPEGPDGPDHRVLQGVAHRLDYYYVIPTFSNPLGAVWSSEARHKVLTLAKQFSFVIIEDSPYEQLWYGNEPPPRLFNLADKNPEVVISMNSLTKIINLAGVRSCYSIAPAWVMEFLLNSKNSPAQLFISQPVLASTILEPLVQDGLIESHSEFLRKRVGPIVREIAQLFPKYLGDFIQLHAEPQGGYFFWGQVVAPEWSSDKMIELAAKNANLKLQAGRGFYADSEAEGRHRTFRIAAPPLENEEDVRSFVQRLRYVFTNEVIEIV